MRVVFDRRGEFRIQVDFRTPKMNNWCSEKVTEGKQRKKEGREGQIRDRGLADKSHHT